MVIWLCFQQTSKCYCVCVYVVLITLFLTKLPTRSCQQSQKYHHSSTPVHICQYSRNQLKRLALLQILIPSQKSCRIAKVFMHLRRMYNLLVYPCTRTPWLLLYCLYPHLRMTTIRFAIKLCFLSHTTLFSASCLCTTEMIFPVLSITCIVTSASCTVNCLTLSARPIPISVVQFSNTSTFM